MCFWFCFWTSKANSSHVSVSVSAPLGPSLHMGVLGQRITWQRGRRVHANPCAGCDLTQLIWCVKCDARCMVRSIHLSSTAPPHFNSFDHNSILINQFNPTLSWQALVDADETIIGIACGDNQTIVVSTSGAVWGWGSYTDKEGKKFFNPSQSGKSIHI